MDSEKAQRSWMARLSDLMPDSLRLAVVRSSAPLFFALAARLLAGRSLTPVAVEPRALAGRWLAPMAVEPWGPASVVLQVQPELSAEYHPRTM